MRRTVGIAAGIVGAAALLFAAQSCGDSTGPNHPTYVANLNAAAEGGTFTSPGSGTVTFVDLGSEITWTMNLTNMTAVTVSHIHLGDATRVGATAGPVIINLFIPNVATPTVNGEVAHGSITNANNANVSLDSLRVLFNNGNSYANVHTTAHPGGEIRDQIHPAP
jgi:CHRD domain-containing protein